MKVFVLVTLLFCAFNSDSLKKRNLSYPYVISNSNLIVEGHISKTSDFEYEFLILKTLKGDSEKRITVNKWKEWTCDHRIKKVKFGQRLLLFLTKNKKGHYDIINGSTGELFIEKDNSVRSFSRPNYPNIIDVKIGIEYFVKYFEFKKINKKNIYTCKASSLQVEKMKNNSDFFKSMLKRINFKK